MPPLLYSFRRCPYAMRARMALAAAEIELRLREVVLRDKPAHMLELSPKGTVPVLQLESGEVLDESRVVMDWALAQADPHGWLAHKDDALIDMFDDDFKHHLDRYKYATRYEGADALEHRAACHEMLQDIEPAPRQWLAGRSGGGLHRYCASAFRAPVPHRRCRLVRQRYGAAACAGLGDALSRLAGLYPHYG
jgi:glutathione S-transferase